MFAKYKNGLYRFIKNPRTKKYEIVTNIREKFYPEFIEYKTGAYKEVTLDIIDLTDIFDVELWVKYDCGYSVFSKEWEIALSGQFLADGKLVLEGNGDIPGWFRPEKHVSRNYIPLNDIESAWVVYRYPKKDGVVLEKPLTIREDISIEKLIELRNYYGGKL